MTSVTRVRVTGGFLDGLDLSLTSGLNVIVGPRGAGKTTLLELLRHALAISEGTPSRDRENFLRHALGAGEIVVDLRTPNGAERLVVDAGGGGARPDVTADIALMLGQNELEEIADSPSRRLALVDMRAGIPANNRPEDVGQLEKLTARAHHLRGRQEALRELLRQRTSLLDDRERLHEREAELLARNAKALGPQREELAALERKLLRVQADLRGALQLRAAKAEIGEAVTPVRDIVLRIETARVESSIQDEVSRLARAIEEALDEIVQASERLDSISTGSSNRLQREDVQLRAAAEPVRTSLDQTEKGLGAVTAELRDLEAQLARLATVESELGDLESEEKRVLSERQLLQERLEETVENIFDARDKAARSITAQLDHRVHISVRHLADTNTFRRTLVELLQGSGLKYNVIADALATTVLPSALLRYVEQSDNEGLSAASGLPQDRASRVIAALDDGRALSQIAASNLNDSVDFSLQDGAVLKSVGQLSTGQKCAVTMPIVLTDTHRIVILDQPEDHLDNQFLVKRIVTSLTRRSNAGAQTIVATHNPNIPVLGGAGQVVSLASDGTRGAVDAVGPFDSQAIVRVITTLMEGGRGAFERRATFYATHSVQ